MRLLLAALVGWLEAQARLANAQAAELQRGTRPMTGGARLGRIDDPVVPIRDGMPRVKA